MKKTAVLLMIAMAFTLRFANAQPGPTPSHQPDTQDKPPISSTMVKMKRDFIRENFIIENDKSDAFWKAYNEFEGSVVAAHKAQRNFRKANMIPSKMTADTLSSMPDDKILKYYENNLATKNLIFKAEEKFFNDIKGILSAKQVAQYYMLEKNFHKTAVNKMRPLQLDRKEMKPIKRETPIQPAERPQPTH